MLTEAGFVAITVHCCELPRYTNRALFRKVDLAGSNEVRFQEFERVWESLVEACPDEISMVWRYYLTFGWAMMKLLALAAFMQITMIKLIGSDQMNNSATEY